METAKEYCSMILPVSGITFKNPRYAPCSKSWGRPLSKSWGRPLSYPSTFVRECQVFILRCVSRVETLDEKNEGKIH